MRRFVVVRSAAARRDLDSIFDHLHGAHLRFGDTEEEARNKAEQRVEVIHDAMERLGHAPFQGTLRDDLMPGLRQVTKDRAVFYFVTEEAMERVSVLAIFYGGQDHQRHMLHRLLGEE